MCNAKKAFAAVTDPLAYALNAAAPTNSLVKVLTPGQSTARRQAGGERLSTSSVGDPGGFFTQTQAQKDAAAFAAGAGQRAADAALGDANNSIAALRSRRRIATGLATGAASGSGQLSTITAYGQSTLG